MEDWRRVERLSKQCEVGRMTPDDVVDRLELIQDMGEATVLYDRLWTEVKTGQ
jgi:hypothetical protein